MLEASRSARLRTVREMLGLSQREFAKELGVAASAVAQWETERRIPPGPIVRLLSLYEEQLGIGPAAKADAPRRPSRAQLSWMARTASTAYAGALWAILRKAELRPNASSFERSVKSAAIDSYVRTLGELKGLGMKFGQLLANVDALDPSLRSDGRSPLSAKMLQAEPMPQAELLEVFLREMRRSPREIFAEWSFAPVYAASIGQVHRAKLRSGEAVAVKVQYPAIVKTLETDLRSVDLLDRLLCAIAPSQRPGAYFAELSERFNEECDYVREAENMRRFARFFAPRNDIRIPKVFDAYSNRRILTAEFVDGQTLEQFARDAAPSARDRAGQAIWEFFYAPSLALGIFHGDPHAGNLLFHEGAVTFLDHGRVGRMSPTFTEHWRELIRSTLEKDRPRIMSVLERMDFLRGGSGGGDELYRMVLGTHLPWLCSGRFAFTFEFTGNAWRLYTDDALRPHLNVPRDSVLWSQLLFGVYSLLVPLRCTVDCRTAMLDRIYAPGEKRPKPYTRAELAVRGIPSAMLSP